jgi:hypothetical protein
VLEITSGRFVRLPSSAEPTLVEEAAAMADARTCAAQIVSIVQQEGTVLIFTADIPHHITSP